MRPFLRLALPAALLAGCSDLPVDPALIPATGTPLQNHAPGHRFTATGFEIILLPGLPAEFSFGDVLALDDHGHAVGRSNAADGQYHPVMWRDGEVVDLGMGPGEAYAINQNDEIVGVKFGPDVERPFLWKDGEYITLPTLLFEGRGRATGINSLGQIVGNVYVEEMGGGRAALWTRNAAGDYELTVLEADEDVVFTQALGINDAGLIVGVSQPRQPEFAPPRAITWTLDGGATDVGPGVIRAVNAAGELAGEYNGADFGPQVFRAFGSDRTDVDLPSDAIGSFVGAINDAGVIAGSAYFDAQRAAIWKGTDYVELGGVEFGHPHSSARAINNTGLVGGNNGPDAALWRVPVPVPPDASPPVIVADVDGTLGDNGWYTSDVTVSWDVSDAESAVAFSDGCGGQLVDYDTEGVSFTCSATSAGGTASETVHIKRDATAPAVSAALVHVGGMGEGNQGNGNHYRVEYSCSDAGSGDASITSASINGVAVANGQTVQLVKSSGNPVVRAAAGQSPLMIKAGAFELVVSCRDAAGNEGIASATI